MDNHIPEPGNREACFLIVVDDSCPVVRRLSWLVRQWDRNHMFRFIDTASGGPKERQLIEQLSQTAWSLMLLDQEGHVWLGPEAIPFILKNLPSGRLAAVAYTVPGTMWLTRKLYHFVSRNRRLLSSSESTGSNYEAA